MALPQPPLLSLRLDRGVWPRTCEEARGQDPRPRVALSRIHALAPEEDGLYLAPPPFTTVRAEMAKNRRSG